MPPRPRPDRLPTDVGGMARRVRHSLHRPAEVNHRLERSDGSRRETMNCLRRAMIKYLAVAVPPQDLRLIHSILPINSGYLGPLTPICPGQPTIGK